MTPFLFAIILSGDAPHPDHSACSVDMMTAVEILADHGIEVSGWCADGGHTLGPDAVLDTAPHMVRPKRRPE